MMNSVPAGVAGTIAEVYVENAQAVEYGQPLFRVAAVTRAVDIVDTTTRDGNQSLWGATGLTAGDILAIAPTLERVGFHALDFTSSTHMAVSVRFHREDPWELIRLMRAAMPDTPLNFITTGMRFIAWQPCDEDVMRLAFRCVVRNGIRRFQFAEPANDPEALRRVARMAREEGVEEIVVGLTYSISPVHTHAYYAERVAALADCADIDRFYLKDPGGLLTTDAVRELAPHFVATGRTIELHSHCTIGLAPLVYLAGFEAGFHVLHTAIGPAGNGTSQPTVESTLRNLEAEGYTHRLDTEALGAGRRVLPGARAREGPAAGCAARVRRRVLPPPAPRRDGDDDTADAGGDRPPRALRCRARRGRARAGGDGLPDPRHAGLPARRLPGDPQRDRPRALARRLGRDGALLPRSLRRVRRAPDPDVVDRVLSLPKVESLRDAQPVSLDGARARFGDRISDEELLLRLTMSQEQVDAMRAAPPLAERPVPAPLTGGDPLVRLLREVERRRSISYLRVRKGDDLVVWRRAS